MSVFLFVICRPVAALSARLERQELSLWWERFPVQADLPACFPVSRIPYLQEQ